MSLLTRWAQPKVNGGLLDTFDFDNFWEGDMWPGNMPLARVPATNVKETETAFLIEMAAPGLEKKDFHVDIKDNVLMIHVEKSQEENEEKDMFRRREYNFYSFQRSFSLPTTVKAEDIKAMYENGVLKLTLPKTVEARKQTAKKITVL